MKQKLIVLLVTLSLLVSYTTAFAGGDQNRGDEGVGGVHQNQVQPPWWVE